MAKTHKRGNQHPTDWRNIADDREKYAAYLCSREWSEKREAVRKRSGGKCERCHLLPMDHVHHLTYARKYGEALEDLQASCKACLEFTYGKSQNDPADFRFGDIIRYGLAMKKMGRLPCPHPLTWGIADAAESGLCAEYLGPCIAMRSLRDLARNVPDSGQYETNCWGEVIYDCVLDKIQEMLPFDYALFLRWDEPSCIPPDYETVMQRWLGFPAECDDWYESKEV